MRRHYESLNYLDGQPNTCLHRFSRTAGSDTGVFSSLSHLTYTYEVNLSREKVRLLRDMLTEVLEDWQ